MDTEIFYKWQPKVTGELKSDTVTLDKSIYKEFKGSYDTRHDDTIEKLERRLWNCHLVATGSRAICFLEDVLSFLEFKQWHYTDDYEKLKLVVRFLKEQDEKSLEVHFEMY